MDFEFSAEERAFAEEVEKFLDENHDPEVMDPFTENFSQLVDTPARRAFMKKLAERGWLGMTWPREYGGQEKEGVYEYILNEALARRYAPQIGKGVGIIGKTLIRHGNEMLKKKFLPMILNAEVEFAVGYSEPNAGSDAANMQLKAARAPGGWTLTGQKVWTTSAHFADWYWVGARTSTHNKHEGISLFLVPMDHEGLEVQATPTIGKDRTNTVFFNEVFVPEDYMVGEEGRGFQYISEALDLERFTMFTFAPIEARVKLLCEWLRGGAARDGERLANDPGTRTDIARLVTETEVARCHSLRFVDAAVKSEGGRGKPPTTKASQYKLFATQLSQRQADVALDIQGPEGQLRAEQERAPLQGRFEGTYRCTVVETIGGGTSEVQKNIIARRLLGLPRNF